ncbi:acyl-CoA thioesterase [Streptomyces violens]|uniref:acyl-CoA thioesterase n=1 Tax=Streptomyces violens TaxID=66377 RepID=UPI000AA995D5|nr:acyl-CoA thioesterase domain-containing protein [Streptomyces violens]
MIKAEFTQPLPPPAPAGVSLPELLDLETVDRDLYRGNVVFDEPFALFGGQVAAQALMAAGRTVGPDRAPHSMHGYFLRAGDSGRPTVFRVERDRDGRSYSARRVVALQDGEVIFSMSTSFHITEAGRDLQATPVPDAPPPDTLPTGTMPRLASFEARQPQQPYPEASWPTRFWARCTADLGDDPLLHTAALTYLSDVLSGLAPLRDESWTPMSSLDHAVWFHRPVRLDDWVLLDLVPHTTGGGRGWYTGTVSSADGVLRASLTQEQLYRQRRTPQEKRVSE